MGQKEYINVEETATLATICEEVRARRIFLVTGKSSYSTSGARMLVEKALAGRIVHRYWDFSLGPNFEDVINGAMLFQEADPDLIVAIGGGTPLDMAKAINVFQAHQGKVDLLDLVTGVEPVRNSGVPLAALPTTAGTGSEATHFSVIYVGDEKYSLAHQSMLPDYAILDSQLTFEQPAYVTACTGIDALCQAIESYWSNSATERSRQYASRAIPALLENIRSAVREPDPVTRTTMSVAANLAGKAINISKTTGPHAFSYGLTRHYGVPHGHAVALMMGQFWELHARIWKQPERVRHPYGAQYLQNTLTQILAWLGVDSHASVARSWNALMQDCGLEVDFKNMGVEAPEDIDAVLGSVNLQRLGNHPVQVEQMEMRRLFESKGRVT